MSEDRPSEVLGALPRTRPHRRSQKRAERPSVGAPGADGTASADDAASADGTAKPRRLAQPAQPDGLPKVSRRRKAPPREGSDLLGTAVQAAAEIAEIGLSVSARALRRAVSRLPKP